jgi:hypothetical protein
MQIERSCILATLQAGKKRYPRSRFVLSVLSLLFALALVGCGTVSQTPAPAARTPLTASQQPGQQVTSTLPPDPSPTASSTTPTPQPTVQSSVLSGPTNFLLNAPFTFSSVNGATTDDNGVTTPLGASTITTEVTQELRYLLFVVDSSNNMKVYSRGASPVAVQLAFNPDSSVTISYTQTENSDAGTISILFSALLSQKQIEVSYEQEYTPSMLINAESSDVVVVFFTHVKWVTPDQIPAAPGNGTYQSTKQGGIALAWSAGQHAVAYDVYRLISDQDQQFQLLATVKGTAYVDNSTEARQNVNATKGITYAIFSVGPTGVENPGGIVLAV